MKNLKQFVKKHELKLAVATVTIGSILLGIQLGSKGRMRAIENMMNAKDLVVINDTLKGEKVYMMISQEALIKLSK